MTISMIRTRPGDAGTGVPAPEDLLKHAAEIRSRFIEVLANHLALAKGDDNIATRKALAEGLALRTFQDVEHRVSQLPVKGAHLVTKAIEQLDFALLLPTAISNDSLVLYLSDPLAPVTRLAKRNLLATSAAVIFLAFATGQVGKIDVLGMDFVGSDRGVIIGALAIVNLYFLVSCFVYRAADIEKHKALQVNATWYAANLEKAVTDLQRDALCAPSELDIRERLVTWCDDATSKLATYRASLSVGGIRGHFDITLPLVVGGVGILAAGLWFALGHCAQPPAPASPTPVVSVAPSAAAPPVRRKRRRPKPSAVADPAPLPSVSATP